MLLESLQFCSEKCISFLSEKLHEKVCKFFQKIFMRMFVIFFSNTFMLNNILLFIDVDFDALNHIKFLLICECDFHRRYYFLIAWFPRMTSKLWIFFVQWLCWYVKYSLVGTMLVMKKKIVVEKYCKNEELTWELSSLLKFPRYIRDLG